MLGIGSIALQKFNMLFKAKITERFVKLQLMQKTVLFHNYLDIINIVMRSCGTLLRQGSLMHSSILC